MTIHFNIQDGSRARSMALHSSASSANQWKSLSQDMAGLFDLVAPDLPGYGTMRHCPEISAKGFAGPAMAIIRQLEKYDEPTHLIGHSCGGGIALKIAMLRPELIKSLTLYEPASFHFLKNGNATQRKLFGEISLLSGQFTASVASGDPALGMQMFIDFWSGSGTWSRLSVDMQRKFSSQAMSVMADFANGFAESWTLQGLEKIDVPTLVLMGMESPEIAQSVATGAAGAIPGARLAMLPGLGHMAPVFSPQWVNPRIIQHIAAAHRAPARLTWPLMAAA